MAIALLCAGCATRPDAQIKTSHVPQEPIVTHDPAKHLDKKHALINPPVTSDDDMEIARLIQDEEIKQMHWKTFQVYVCRLLESQGYTMF